MLLCMIFFPTFASTAAAGMTPKAGSGADLGVEQHWEGLVSKCTLQFSHDTASPALTELSMPNADVLCMTGNPQVDSRT